jgi:hypothetical protein
LLRSPLARALNSPGSGRGWQPGRPQ